MNSTVDNTIDKQAGVIQDLSTHTLLHPQPKELALVSKEGQALCNTARLVKPIMLLLGDKCPVGIPFIGTSAYIHKVPANFLGREVHLNLKYNLSSIAGNFATLINRFNEVTTIQKC